MRSLLSARSLFLAVMFVLGLMAFSAPSFAQVGVVISVGFAPPEIPVYEQPICPGDGYIWTPGYWAWDGSDYYWVPGTWILAPEVGFFWTPPYWGWGGAAFIFHEGYWGPRVGFYGGINYGFGYFGHGYEGGRWENGHFFYNHAVNNINVTVMHNVYNTRVTISNSSHVSYNGGRGGIDARATAEEEAAARERHIPPVATQTQHIEAARGNQELRASVNHGKPPIAATPRAADFRTDVVPAKSAAHYNSPARVANEPTRAAVHPNELAPHNRTVAPNTGNPKLDQKYQQEQEKLNAKQEQEHQQLQKKQEQEHQQLEKQHASEAQRQQLEDKHQQQTQQMEQRHTQEQQHLVQRQQPAHQATHESSPRH